jgi:hypothetical protein
MFKFLKNIKFRFGMTYKDYLAIFLAINVAVLIFIMILTVGIRNMVGLMERQIQILQIDRRNQMIDLYNILKSTAKMSIINANTLEILTENIQGLENSLIKAKKTMKKMKRIDLANIENIKEANLIIYNSTEGTGGSGTHIKIRGNSYILSVAHMLNKKDDRLFGITNDGTFYPLTLEKLDKKHDLSLFKIKGIEDLPYLEIAEEAPKPGSEIVIIGNPDSLEDIVTEGIIAKTTKTGYIFTNLVFFGNSGGAILYKGKIVGVVSKLRTYFGFPIIFVNYGYGVNLEILQQFLTYVKPY